MWPVNDERGSDWTAAVRPGARIGHAVEAHGVIGSTNDRARELLRDRAGAGILVLAETQVAGRGRRGRAWASAPGRNLAVSVALRPALAAERAWQLGFAVALAAAEACGTAATVRLKWPNDIVAGDGRKVGGILVETALHGDRVAEAVIGIGINVNWAIDEMPPEIATSATSLAELAGHAISRPGLLRALAEALEREVTAVEAGRSPLERYRRACATIGAVVEVETPSGRVEGRARSVDESGALVIDATDGPIAVSSGEVVRVRPAVPA